MSHIDGFLTNLESTSPTFARARAAHDAYNEGTLPYVLLEDDLREWLARGVAMESDEALSVLRIVEEAFQKGDEELQTLIAITLLEGLGQDAARPDEQALRQRLGPTLRAELERMEG